MTNEALMHEVLVNAIEHKQRLRCVYDHKLRLIEPQCYGIGTHRSELLRVHQLKGGTQREPLFNVSKIVDIEVLNETFTHPGPN